MFTFICSLLFETGISRYYEKPWVDFFGQNTRLLILETIFVFILNYFLPTKHVKLLYSIYCYIYLLRTVYVLYSCQEYISFNEALRIKLAKINRGFIGFTILIGFRNFIYGHVIIDILSILFGAIVCYRKRLIIKNAIKLIYSNLTGHMRRAFYIYLAITAINIGITIYI